MPPPAERTESPPHGGPLGGSQGRKDESVAVLLVDDRPENTYAMRRAVGALGAPVHEAHSGQEALGLMLRHHYAVVVLDVRMPGMSGLEVAELMRGHDRTRSIPIIFVTGESTTPEEIFDGYGAGAVDYLTKPVHPGVLRSKVSVFLELDRRTRALAVMAELQRTQRTLESATDDLSSFARAASHDLREPARTIRILASRLLRSLPDAGESDSAVDLGDIAGLADRMLRIVQALGDYAALAAETTWSRLNLTSLVGEVRNELGEAIEASLASVEIGPLPRAYGHLEQIKELFRQLLGNALRYRREQVTPEIRVTSRSLEADEIRERRLDGRRSYACVSVTDNGVGTDPHRREELFQAFVHLHSRDLVQGAHMGLAICRRIVERHAGLIEVESEIGVGTTVSLILPRDEEEVPAPEDPPVVPEQPALEPSSSRASRSVLEG